VQADVGPTFSTGKYRGYVCDVCGEEFPHETSRDVHFRRAQRGLGCRANAQAHQTPEATAKGGMVPPVVGNSGTEEIQ
jgi:hypothetical protein